MRSIPFAPPVLGLAGLLPFGWGVLTQFWPELGLWTAQTLSPRLAGPYVQLAYGTVILSFMSGVLWGFATRAEGSRAAAGYALSVIPALWAFFMVGSGPVTAAGNLMAGFVALLLLDWQFARWGLTPEWWMRLRVLLTTGVVLSLLPVWLG